MDVNDCTAEVFCAGGLGALEASFACGYLQGESVVRLQSDGTAKLPFFLFRVGLASFRS
jgi:hypothetical protein